MSNDMSGELMFDVVHDCNAFGGNGAAVSLMNSPAPGALYSVASVGQSTAPGTTPNGNEMGNSQGASV
jgi:hypothetical protein